VDPHPFQHRELMKQQLEEQRRYAARRRASPAVSGRSRLVRPLSRPLARLFLRLAFALDSSTAWKGLWELTPASDPASSADKRPG